MFIELESNKVRGLSLDDDSPGTPMDCLEVGVLQTLDLMS